MQNLRLNVKQVSEEEDSTLIATVTATTAAIAVPLEV